MRTARKVATGALTGVLAAIFLLYWMRAPYVVAIGAAAVLAFCVLAIRTSSDDVPARLAEEAWLAAAPDLPPASERTAMESHQSKVQSPVPVPAAASAAAAAAATQPPGTRAATATAPRSGEVASAGSNASGREPPSR